MNLTNLKMMALVSLAVAPVAASAQMNMTGRLSTINYGYLYGGGPDVFSDNYLDTRGSVVQSDTMEAHFAQEGEGWYPPANLHWIAGVSVDAVHQFAVTGPLNNANSISGSGSSLLSCFALEDGLATINCTNPGNSVILNFSLTSPTDYRLSGFFETTDGTVLPGEVALQRFDGIVWQYAHTSLFLPGSEGSFDWTGTATPGDYRLVAEIRQGASGNATRGGSYAYNLTMGSVPEPATLAVFGLGIAALVRRRKK